jgi:hypothetical protein
MDIYAYLRLAQALFLLSEAEFTQISRLSSFRFGIADDRLNSIAQQFSIKTTIPQAGSIQPAGRSAQLN